MDDSPDRDLILRARRGETEAFGVLVRQSQAAVFNVCYRMMGERREAEDMAQESFLRAYERLESFDAERPFLPWMRRVAANLCLNRLAERTPMQAELNEELDAADANDEPAPRSEERERAGLIRAALLELPGRYRIVIELRHFQELSYEEISQTLGLPLSDVKSDLFRARKMLAARLKNDASL